MTSLPDETSNDTTINSVNKLKLEGNELYASKKYIPAIRKYTEAIDLDETSSTLWSNRSAAYM